MHDAAHGQVPAAETTASIRDLLLLHLGRIIEVNAADPTDVAPAILAAVHGEYFSVICQATHQAFHFPYRCILSAAEPPDQEGGRLFLEVYRQVFVKGSVGFRVSVPV